jgi:hypothetical protein
MSVLGYKLKSQDTNFDDKKGIQLSPTFVDKDSVLVGMYFNNSNREQQEIVEVAPHSVKPITQIDKNLLIKMCKEAVLHNEEVVGALIKHLIKEGTSQQE